MRDRMGKFQVEGRRGMVTALKRRVVGRIPAIRRRDEALTEQRAQLRKVSRRLDKLRQQYRDNVDESTGLRRELERSREITRHQRAQLSEESAKLKSVKSTLAKEREWRQSDRYTPSFRSQYHDMRRIAQRAIRIDPVGWHPYRQLKRKLRNYEFASSHDVRTPAVFRVWPTVESIDLTGLPESFVLKSDFGASGRGVFLQSASGELLGASDRRAFSAADTLRDISVKRDKGFIQGPYFAEELLLQPNGKPVSTDVKVYAAYGRVVQVLLRSIHFDDPESPIRARYLNADGVDLGQVSEVLPIDDGIDAPASFDEMLSIARHLSRAAGVPFCRIDLYETQKGVVFGELTLTPGGPQVYSPEHDVRIGTIWTDAQVERELDLVRGRPFGLIHGMHEASPLYPLDHVSRSPDPGPWDVRNAACGVWCFGGRTQFPEYDVEHADPEPPEPSPRDERLRRLESGPS